MATTGYTLLDGHGNPPVARVDDKRLERGGVPVALSDDQAQRLRDAGVTLSNATTAVGYDALTVKQLEAETQERGLDVNGSGTDGAALKADLVAALDDDNKED